MTSQSPATETIKPSEDYIQAWSSLMRLVKEENLSWSGRERNRAFISIKGETFVDASSILNLDFLEDSRSVSKCDWDNNGHVDIVVRSRNAPRLRLMLNECGQEEECDCNWIKIKLKGDGEKVNFDAIGAEVTITGENFIKTQTLMAGSGYLNQNSKTLLFGLRHLKNIDEIKVVWPNGEHTLVKDLESNQEILISKEGGLDKAIAIDNAAKLFVNATKSWLASRDNTISRVPLATKMPVGDIPLPSNTNLNRKIKDFKGRPVLINFWSTQCSICLEELNELGEYKNRKFNLAIVPMLADTNPDKDLANKILSTVNLSKYAGVAGKRERDVVKILTEEVLGKGIETPLPMSLLIDSQSNLVAIYIGKMQLPGLIRDLQLIRQISPNEDLSHLSFGRRVVIKDRSFESLHNEFTKIGELELAKTYSTHIGRLAPK